MLIEDIAHGQIQVFNLKNKKKNNKKNKKENKITYHKIHESHVVLKDENVEKHNEDHPHKIYGYSFGKFENCLQFLSQSVMPHQV